MDQLLRQTVPYRPVSVEKIKQQMTHVADLLNFHSIRNAVSDAVIRCYLHALPSQLNAVKLSLFV